MKGTTIFFLSILLITTGCKRLDQTADDLITVDVTNNSFPKKELALQDFMDVLKSATIIQYTIKGRFMSR